MRGNKTQSNDVKSDTEDKKQIIQTPHFKLTFDFLPDRHIKFAFLQLLPCWDLQREAAVIQYLSTSDRSPSAVFPYHHPAFCPVGLEGVAVSVWTSLRWTDLFQTRVAEVYFERFGRRGLQVPGDRSVKIEQRK